MNLYKYGVYGLGNKKSVIITDVFVFAKNRKDAEEKARKMYGGKDVLEIWLKEISEEAPPLGLKSDKGDVGFGPKSK